MIEFKIVRILLVPLFFLEAFVLMIGWGIISSWFNGPTISYVQAMMICVIMSGISLYPMIHRMMVESVLEDLKK